MNTQLKTLNLKLFSVVFCCECQKEVVGVILAKNQDSANEIALAQSKEFDDLINFYVDEIYVNDAGYAQVSDSTF